MNEWHSDVVLAMLPMYFGSVHSFTHTPTLINVIFTLTHPNYITIAYCD